MSRTSELTIVGYGRFCKKNIALAGHSSSNRMDSKSNLDSSGYEHSGNLRDSILRFRNSHAIANNLTRD